MQTFLSQGFRSSVRVINGLNAKVTLHHSQKLLFMEYSKVRIVHKAYGSFIRLSLVRFSKLTAIVRSGDTGFPLVIIGTIFERNKRQLIEFRILAFVLVPKPRVWSFTKPKYACTFVSRDPLILKIKNFRALEL